MKVCPNTLCTILKSMGYSLKINYKKIECNKILTPQERHARNQQFLYIEKQRNNFQKRKYGIISIDSKKKEYIGNFINKGSCWLKVSKEVFAYDYPSWATGVGIPYGIYDISHNQGTVNIGTSYNTGEFAVNSIKRWWETIGYKYYGREKKLLILADSGGSNGCRLKYWKFGLQYEICNKYGISISVSHYPTGTSKYNPIEHLLFSQISNNWKGEPLKNYETMLKFISTTTTNKGLTVSAYLDNNEYEKGIKIKDKQMKELNIEFHKVNPKWNYTICPS